MTKSIQTGNKNSRNRQSSESTIHASAQKITMLKQAYIGSNKTNQVILDSKNGTQLMRKQKDVDVKSNYTQVRTKK